MKDEDHKLGESFGMKIKSNFTFRTIHENTFQINYGVKCLRENEKQ